MKIAELKQKYQNKWVLVQVLREDPTKGILDVKPLKVSFKREDIYRLLPKLKKGMHVATLYMGAIPEKGMVYAFLWLS